MPKKKNVKNTSRKAGSRSVAGLLDDHSFLIILGGGFIIIMIVIVFLANQATFYRAAMTKLTSQVVASKDQIITIDSFDFSPKTITVKAGSSVTWLNSDTVDHSIIADDATFNTGMLASGEKGSYTFTKVGTYTYHCAVHPSMTATVVVE